MQRDAHYEHDLQKERKMSKQSVLVSARGALDETRLRREALKAKATATIIDLQERRMKSELTRRERAKKLLAKQRARSRVIMGGLKALVELGSEPEVQELIKETGFNLTLFAFSESLPPHRESPVTWNFSTSVSLSPSAIVLRDTFMINGELACDSLRRCHATILDLEYATADSWLASRWLRKQIGAQPKVSIAGEKWEDKHGGSADRERMLWQVVADCASPKRLEDYFMKALR